MSAAYADLRQGLASWRLWWTLGANDIAQRYRRSQLGQFWITASMAVFIGAISIVYSTLFGIDMREYAPFLVVNIVVWTSISATITDGCSAFIQAEGYLKQEALPKTLFPFRVLTRNLIVLAHNAVLIPVVFLLTGTKASWTMLLALPGLVLVSANGFLLVLLLGMACTRFRDLPQVVANLVQVGLFVTPVMWRPEQVLERIPWLVMWNPFANHLALVSSPIAGAVPPAWAYVYCVSAFFILVVGVGALFVRFRDRIVYWL